jgi:hypothetical protein
MEIEVVETVSDKEQDKWGPLNLEQVKLSLVFVVFLLNLSID